MTMKIIKTTIKVKDLIEDYSDDKSTSQVIGYGKRLDIRPKYQREFIYKDKQREEVIRTILKGFPLNTIYWAKTGADSYEVLDGQQRTISICQYCTGGSFFIEFEKGNPKAFFNLTEAEKEQILNYELDVYQCDGTDKERLEWFKVINIAGEALTNQELRNAVYSGEWISKAKQLFVNLTGVGVVKFGRYFNGSRERQDWLETILDWKSSAEGKTIEEYMAEHQNDAVLVDGKPESFPLYKYIFDVFAWVNKTFPCLDSNYEKEAKKVDWGLLYNKYHNDQPNIPDLEKQIKELMMDSDVTKKSGIFGYVLGEDEKCLSIRDFDDNTKREVYEEQNHQCPDCVAEGNTQEYKLKEMHGDHNIPWSKGGHTVKSNCVMRCKKHNLRKSNK